MSNENKDNANELSEMIRRRNKKRQEELEEEEEINKKRIKKRQEELEEEEEEERKRRIQHQDTEEDDDESDYDDKEDEEQDNKKNEDTKEKDNNDRNSEKNDKNEDKRNNIDNKEKNQTNNSNSQHKSTESQSNTGVGQVNNRPNGGMKPNTNPPVSQSSSAVNAGETVTTGAANAGRAVGTTAGKTAAGGTATGGTVAGAGIGVFSAVIIAILIIFVLIGIIFFFITMPGAVVGKIGDAINSVRKMIDSFVDGDNYAKILISREDMIDAAEYLDQMGYDLKGYGFLSKDAEHVLTARNDESWKANLNDWWNKNDINESPTYKDFSTKSLEDRKKEEPDGDFVQVYLSSNEEVEKILKINDFSNAVFDNILNDNILFVKDSEGNVEFIKSKYLAQYLTADNAVYLISNYNTNILNRALKLIDLNDNNGSGLISFVKGGSNVGEYITNADEEKIDSEFADAEKWGIFDRVSIDRDNRSMKIENTDDGWLRTSYYVYNLDGWVTKYGVPLKLSLVNHLSSMAPDFAYQIAKIGAQDTKVKLGLVKTKGNTYKMKLYLDMGDGKKYYYVEKKKTDSWNLTKLNTDSSGNEYSSGQYDARTLLGYSTDTDIETIKSKKPQSKTGNELIKEIDNLEKELKQETNNGENKIDIGQFILAFGLSYGDTSPFDKYVDDETTVANMLGQNIDGSNPTGIVNVYKYSDGTSPTILNVRSSESLSKFVKLLYNNGLVDIVEYEDAIMGDPGYGKKYYSFNLNNNIDTNAVSRLKNIFLTYFYQSKDLISIVEEKTQSILNYKKMPDQVTDKNGIRVYNNTKDSALTLIKDEEEIGKYSEYKENKYLIYNPNGNYDNDGTGWTNDEFGYYKANMSTIWEFLFNEKGYNYYEYLIQYTFDELRETKTFYRFIDENTGEAYTDIGNNFDFTQNESSYYDNKSGWFWEGSIPVKVENAFNKEIKDGEEGITGKEVANILNKIDEAETNDFTKYEPIILEVQNHWYQDISFKDCYIWDSSEGAKETVGIYVANNTDNSGIKKAANKGIIYTVEKTKGKIVQKADAKTVGGAGEKVQNILSNGDGNDDKKFNIYNGVTKTRGNIDFKNTAVDAIAMLEEIQGEDAQEIIRMYKELMLKYGIYFKESAQTELKKELFSRIIEGYSEKEKILSEGDDSVIKANIPPAQEGFEKDLNVLMPIKGKITRKTDDSLCIEIISKGDDFDKYTIFISGFDVDKSLEVGKVLSQGSVIGKTKIQDIKLTLRDNNGSIVKNEYVTMDITTEQQVSGNGQEASFLASVQGKRTEEDILYTVKNCKYFSDKEYANIKSMMPGLLKMQDDFNIDPLVAIALFHNESHCGVAYESYGQIRLANIGRWDGQKGVIGFSNNGFGCYSSFADGAYDFGNYVKNSTALKGATKVKDLQSHNGYNIIFQNAASTTGNLYEQLRNILKGKNL